MPSHAGPPDLGRWPASFDYHYSLEQAPVHDRGTFGAHSSEAILPPDNQSCQPGLIPGCAVSPEPGASAKKEWAPGLVLAAIAPWWIPDRFTLCHAHRYEQPRYFSLEVLSRDVTRCFGIGSVSLFFFAGLEYACASSCGIPILRMNWHPYSP